MGAQATPNGVTQLVAEATRPSLEECVTRLGSPATAGGVRAGADLPCNPRLAPPFSAPTGSATCSSSTSSTRTRSCAMPISAGPLPPAAPNPPTRRPQRECHLQRPARPPRGERAAGRPPCDERAIFSPPLARTALPGAGSDPAARPRLQAAEMLIKNCGRPVRVCAAHPTFLKPIEDHATAKKVGTGAARAVPRSRPLTAAVRRRATARRSARRWRSSSSGARRSSHCRRSCRGMGSCSHACREWCGPSPHASLSPVAACLTPPDSPLPARLCQGLPFPEEYEDVPVFTPPASHAEAPCGELLPPCDEWGCPLAWQLTPSAHCLAGALLRRAPRANTSSNSSRRGGRRRRTRWTQSIGN